LRDETLSDSGAAVQDAPPTPLVALVGPPNSGKTTLFNQLTGLRQKVANYPGVTVEKKVGKVALPDGRELELVDLPGVHGFSARTLDEQVTRDVLEGRVDGFRTPDALVLIVDSTRLESQLMLVEPVLELDLPTLLVLNMSDELEERGGRVDNGPLEERLGVKVVRTSARTGSGVDEVREFLAADVAVTQPAIDAQPRTLTNIPRGVALPMVDAFTARRARVREVVEQAGFRPPGPSDVSERMDHVFLHRVWGPLVFLTVVVLVFESIFTWAVPLMDGVELVVGSSGGWLTSTLPDTWFRSLLVDGVWAGVGSVVIFLPQILILFFFLGVLEDSGYMARAAVIADRMMYRVGLQGRAFLPLLSGYACAVPAILAARTVEDERDRLATIFVTPFMTCSARLPVYALLIAAFIPAEPFFGPIGKRAAALLGLYGLGIVAAIGTAFLLKRTILKAEPTAFLMELPPYRIPSLRSLGLRLVDRSGIFLKRVGKVIFTVSIVLWTLTQFPRTELGPPLIEDSALASMGHVIEPVIAPLGFDWRVGVGLVTSLAAREVIVGTLGTIYGVEAAGDESFALQDALAEAMTPAAAIGLLIFFAFALQCMSTVAVMRRETAGWKWPALQFTYMLVLAYAGAFVAVRVF
jgi:ferrous iron transport protein B